jgi:RNA polymerase sigma factor (sigma-70 family)
MTAMLSDLVGRLNTRSEPRATDGDLLGQFLADRDEQAFASIVQRHGPLVFGVCRRVTGDHHLAEDAFQAVFVVLAAKAGSIRPRSALPAWLYGVAYRIALRARTMSARRLRREESVETLPERASVVVERAEVADLTAILDEEIARLPQYQRGPVVLCELEGQPRQEAAAKLGISEGTLSSRLARARRALADRLRRRGIAPSAATITAALAEYASARVPVGLASKAVACAIRHRLIPADVATLSDGVERVLYIQ